MPVEKAKSHEIPGVVHMAARVYKWGTGKDDFNEAVSAGNWIHLTESGEGVVFQVKDELGVAGFICGYKARNIDTGKWTAQMWHWYVEPRATGQGIALLRRFEAWAKEVGCEVTSIGCTAGLWRSKHRALYDRLGYKLDSMSFSKETV